MRPNLDAWKEAVRNAFNYPGIKTALLVIIALILVASALGAWRAYSLPETVVETVEQVHFQHNSSFDYLTLVNPGHMYGTPPEEEAPDEEENGKDAYFRNYIDDVEIEFHYGLVADRPATNVLSEVEVVAIIDGPSGWQKEMAVMSATDFEDSLAINFPTAAG